MIVSASLAFFQYLNESGLMDPKVSIEPSLGLPLGITGTRQTTAKNPAI